MWLRELKKYLRSRSRILGALGQPITYLFALGYEFGSVFRDAGRGSYIQFLVPGIVAMSIIFTSIFNGMQIIWDRQFGFLKETLVAPVPRIAVMVGRTLGGATIATLQGGIVLVLTLFFGFQPYRWGLVVPAIFMMFLVASLFSAFGIMVASLLTDVQGFQLIMNLLVMPIFLLSGSLFPLTNIPLALKAVATADPLSYGVDGLRTLLTNTSQFGIATDVTGLCAVASVLLGIGSYCFARIEP
jgi:ABC-2 type transport system permease protein